MRPQLDAEIRRAMSELVSAAAPPLPAPSAIEVAVDEPGRARTGRAGALLAAVCLVGAAAGVIVAVRHARDKVDVTDPVVSVQPTSPPTQPTVGTLDATTLAPTTLVPTTSVPTTEAPAPSSTIGAAVPVVATITWVDHPARPNQRAEWARTLPTSLLEAPLCSLRFLDVVPGADGAMGSLYGGLQVHNLGDTACEMQSVPVVRLLDDQGTVIQSTDPASAQPDAPGVVLEPDSWAVASLWIVGSNVCGGLQSSQLELTWNGEVAIVPFEIGRPADHESCTDVIDGPYPGHLQATGDGLAFGPLPEPSAMQMYGLATAQLAVTLESPGTVRAGTSLRYSVLVTNKGGGGPVVITSSNCPIYEASIGAVHIDQLMHCDDEGVVLQPGDSARYEMQIDVPKTAPLGPQTLTWTSTEPTGLSATQTVEITAA